MPFIIARPHFVITLSWLFKENWFPGNSRNCSKTPEVEPSISLWGWLVGGGSDCEGRSCDSFNKVLYLKSFWRLGWLLFFFLIVVPISTATAGLLFWLSLGRDVLMRTRKKCTSLHKKGELAGTYVVVAVLNGTTVLIHRSWYKWIRNLSPNGQWRGGFKNSKTEQMGTVPTGKKGWGWIVNWRESSNRERTVNRMTLNYIAACTKWCGTFGKMQFKAPLLALVMLFSGSGC